MPIHFYNDSDIGYDIEWYESKIEDKTQDKIEEQIEELEEIQ